MGANSKQGVAILSFLLAFTALAGAMAGGSLVLILVAAAGFAVSLGIFLKAKPWEHMHK